MTTKRARRRFVGMTARSGVAHQPGLDGLRGLAVAAVVLFHTGLGWLPGGFLGVSLFFTLSGVVIGTVIIHELRATRHFSLRRFWTRRARRLLPGAWIVLALIALGRLLTPHFSATTDGDIVASWLHVANWQFLAKDHSYQDLFAGPSAVLHFWSLAIEEQFYLVVGLLAIGIAAVSKRPARTLGIVAGAGALVSFALPFLFSPSIDRVYYGTDTRAGELLVGLVLASWLSASRRRARLLTHSRAVVVSGIVAVGITVVAWRFIGPGDESIRSGLLPATSVVSVALIVAAVVPRGPVYRLASLSPLRALGAISYGVYLIHWPVFVLIAGYAASAWWRLLVGVPISIALAVVSARLIELPIRGRRVGRVPLAVAGTAVTAFLVAAIILPVQQSSTDEFLDQLADDASIEAPGTLDPNTSDTTTPPVTTDRPTTTLDIARAPTSTARTTARTTTTVTRPSRTTRTSTTSTTSTTSRTATTSTTDFHLPRRPQIVVPDADPPRELGPNDLAPRPDVDAETPVVEETATPAEPTAVGIFGDSIALSLALTRSYLPPSERYVMTDGVADIGCGSLLSPVPTDDGRCESARSRWTAAVTSVGIDLPVVMSCQWELVAQPVGDDPTVRVIGDPVYDEYLTGELAAMVDQLRAAGARRVALVRCPELSPAVGVDGLTPLLRESRDPARVARWNQLLDQLAAERRDVVSVDLAAWVNDRRDDATVRPDGEHFTYEVDTGVAAELGRLLEGVT